MTRGGDVVGMTRGNDVGMGNVVATCDLPTSSIIIFPGWPHAAVEIDAAYQSISAIVQLIPLPIPIRAMRSPGRSFPA